MQNFGPSLKRHFAPFGMKLDPINVYKLGEEKKNAESVRRMAYKAHFSKREYD